MMPAFCCFETVKILNIFECRIDWQVQEVSKWATSRIGMLCQCPRLRLPGLQWLLSRFLSPVTFCLFFYFFLFFQWFLCLEIWNSSILVVFSWKSSLADEFTDHTRFSRAKALKKQFEKDFGAGRERRESRQTVSNSRFLISAVWSTLHCFAN